MSTYLLMGFKRRDVFLQRQRDEIGFLVDAPDALTAVAAARKIVGGYVALFDGLEIESAPDEIKQQVKPLAQLEDYIVRKPDGGAEFMIR